MKDQTINQLKQQLSKLLQMVLNNMKVKWTLWMIKGKSVLELLEEDMEDTVIVSLKEEEDTNSTNSEIEDFLPLLKYK